MAEHLVFRGDAKNKSGKKFDFLYAVNTSTGKVVSRVDISWTYANPSEEDGDYDDDPPGYRSYQRVNNLVTISGEFFITSHWMYRGRADPLYGIDVWRYDFETNQIVHHWRSWDVDCNHIIFPGNCLLFSKWDGNWDMNTKRKIVLVDLKKKGKYLWSLPTKSHRVDLAYVAKNLFLVADIIGKNMEIRNINAGELVYRFDFLAAYLSSSGQQLFYTLSTDQEKQEKQKHGYLLDLKSLVSMSAPLSTKRIKEYPRDLSAVVDIIPDDCVQLLEDEKTLDVKFFPTTNFLLIT